MPTSVYKYILDPQAVNEDSETILELPKDAKILTVGSQFDSQMCLWALVDTEAEKEERKFAIFGTGHEIPLISYMAQSDFDLDNARFDKEVPAGKILHYLGSTQLMGGRLVFHVFEVYIKVKIG